MNDRPQGTKHIYRIDPDGLGTIRAWLDRLWGNALEAYRAEVEEVDKRDDEADNAQ